MFFSDVENLNSAVSSHRINYKFIYIHILISWGFSSEFNLSNEQREITLTYFTKNLNKEENSSKKGYGCK